MADNEEQDFQSELRQAQTASASKPAEEPQEEAPPEEPETLESPEAERAAQGALSGKKARLAAQKKTGQGIKLAGRMGQATSFIFQRVGTTLVSFGVGTGLTIIGLVFGLPLLLIGVIFLIIGLFASMASRATITAGETIVEKAKKEEKKLAKTEGGGGGGGVLGAVQEAGEAAGSMKKYASFIAGPFIYIGCTILGLLSGFIFLAMIIGFLVS
ncbi:hypothetical protein HZB93_04615 [Candidatus Falkowbacteria bacterium]|nr:hypothetical protein [Candidatus Falkowbacteria bacterium]